MAVGKVTHRYRFRNSGTTPIVLGLLHDHTTYFTGIGYLLLYNLIFILPLVLILLIASDKSLLAKVQAWRQSERKVMRWAGGTAMVALVLVIFAV